MSFLELGSHSRMPALILVLQKGLSTGRWKKNMNKRHVSEGGNKSAPFGRWLSVLYRKSAEAGACSPELAQESEEPTAHGSPQSRPHVNNEHTEDKRLVKPQMIPSIRDYLVLNYDLLEIIKCWFPKSVKGEGAEKMAQLLRALSVLIEELTLFPSTHTGPLTTTCNSNCREGVDILFWPTQAPARVWACTHLFAYTNTK